MTVADIDKAIDVVRKLGPDTIFWKTGAESQQLAESGEADMLMMWTGRAMTAVKNGAKYTPAWQDWLVVMDQMTIPVGVKDTDASYALLNAYLGKQSQEILAETDLLHADQQRRAAQGRRVRRRLPDQHAGAPEAGLPAEHQVLGRELRGGAGEVVGADGRQLNELT